MRVDWWSRARADVLHIAETISVDSPTAARELVARTDSRVATLRQFSHLGRVGRHPRSRELLITGTPYIVVYRIHSDKVAVMRVIHGKQRWPPRRG